MRFYRGRKRKLGFLGGFLLVFVVFFQILWEDFIEVENAGGCITGHKLPDGDLGGILELGMPFVPVVKPEVLGWPGGS